MGAVAQQEVFHTTPSKANGVWRYKDDHVVVGCFHPAYLLRTPHEVANVIEIFKKVKEYANV